ncbi:hypothetical protein D3C84_1241570 [compost metagenome]
MMNADLQRRVRRIDRSLLLQRTPAEAPDEAVAAAQKPVKTKVAAVPPAGTKSTAREIVDSDDWVETMKEKGLTGKPVIKLW